MNLTNTMKTKRFKVVIECKDKEDAYWIKRIVKGFESTPDRHPAAASIAILIEALLRATVKN